MLVHCIFLEVVENYHRPFIVVQDFHIFGTHVDQGCCNLILEPDWVEILQFHVQSHAVLGLLQGYVSCQEILKTQAIRQD